MYSLKFDQIRGLNEVRRDEVIYAIVKTHKRQLN